MSLLRVFPLPLPNEHMFHIAGLHTLSHEDENLDVVRSFFRFGACHLLLMKSDNFILFNCFTTGENWLAALKMLWLRGLWVMAKGLLSEFGSPLVLFFLNSVICTRMFSNLLMTALIKFHDSVVLLGMV